MHRNTVGQYVRERARERRRERRSWFAWGTLCGFAAAWILGRMIP
jgi:hypothetical protein